jgi:hypothetical protein
MHKLVGQLGGNHQRLVSPVVVTRLFPLGCLNQLSRIVALILSINLKTRIFKSRFFKSFPQTF